MNKSFSKIWTIIIVGIFLAGGILAWQYSKVPKVPMPTPTPITEITPTPKAESPKVEIQEGKINEALSICVKIKDVQKRNICTGIVNGDLGACEILPDHEKVNCYVSLGRRTGDSSICERFKDEGFKYDCLSRLSGDYEQCKKSVFPLYCYYDLALIKKDSSGCGKITDELYKFLSNKCFAHTERNSDYCQDISQETISDDCYIDVAMLTNNSSICQKAKGYKDLCQSMVTRNIGGLNCGAYGGYCEIFAGFTGDDSICPKMTNADDCYHDAAMGLLGIYPPEAPRGW